MTAQRYRVPQWRVHMVRDGSTPMDSPHVGDAQAVATLARAVIGDPCVEHVLVIGLDNRMRAVGTVLAAIGTEGQAYQTASSLLRAVLGMGKARTWAHVHNHPSGDATFSPEDVRSTTAIYQAALVVGLPLVDAIVLGDDGSWSSMYAERLGPWANG